MMTNLYPTGYGLAAIVGLTEAQVSALVDQAHTTQAPVYVGNINAPRQIVIAGSDEGMTRVLEAARKSGARKANASTSPYPRIAHFSSPSRQHCE